MTSSIAVTYPYPLHTFLKPASHAHKLASNLPQTPLTSLNSAVTGTKLAEKSITLPVHLNWLLLVSHAIHTRQTYTKLPSDYTILPMRLNSSSSVLTSASQCNRPINNRKQADHKRGRTCSPLIAHRQGSLLVESRNSKEQRYQKVQIQAPTS